MEVYWREFYCPRCHWWRRLPVVPGHRHTRCICGYVIELPEYAQPIEFRKVLRKLWDKLFKRLLDRIRFWALPA